MKSLSPDLVTLLRYFSHVSQGLELPTLSKRAYVDLLELESTSTCEITLRLYAHLLSKDELLEHSALQALVSLMLTHPGIHHHVFQTNDFISYDHFLFQDGGLFEILERESRRVLEQNSLDPKPDMEGLISMIWRYIEK